MKKLWFVFVVVLLAFINLNACTTKTKVDNLAGNVPAGVTALEVKQAIIDAANIREWSLQEQDSSTFIATHSRDIYSATVRIQYTPTSYVITYVSSTGFKIKGNEIDKHYNDWVIILDKEIQKSLNKQQNLKLTRHSK